MHLKAAVLLGCLATPPLAAQCLVAVESIDFPAYDPSDPAPLDGEGRLTLWCEDRTAVSIAITPGPAARRLAGPTGELPYQLYRDAARTRPWGDGIDGEARRLINPGRRQTLSIYARIPPGHHPPPGTYHDLVVVEVRW